MKKFIDPNQMILVVIIMLSFITNLQAQKNQISNEGVQPINRSIDGDFVTENVMLKNNFKKIEGTYQIQVTLQDYSVPLSESLYGKIQSERNEDQDVYLVIDANSKLFLPSKRKIKAVGFEKLDPIKLIIK